MATLRSQFDRALTNIQINGDKTDRAVAVQSEVRDVLEADVQLRAWGVDTKLIGSYGRNTGIYPGKDVDVFVKLTELDTNAPPQAVYDAVWDALAREYGTRAEAQDRSIKVDFSDSGSPGGPSPFSADAVPAVHAGQHWAIPAGTGTCGPATLTGGSSQIRNASVSYPPRLAPLRRAPRWEGVTRTSQS